MGIALKASIKYIESSSQDKKEVDDLEDIKYLTRKFNKFLDKDKEVKDTNKEKNTHLL